MKPSSTKPLQKTYSFPTIEKNGELAVFYNLAYNRVSSFIMLHEKNGKELRALFKEGDIPHERFTENLLSDSTYTNLKIDLWREQKGGSIKFVKPWEKEMINHMLHLLWRLRDFHSHYWHDNSGIVVFDERFRAFIIEKFNEAVTSYSSRYSFAQKYHQNRPPIMIDSENNRLTRDGINFFLSFFLAKSQMELFMNSREFLKNKGVKKESKNSEIIRDYDFIRKVNTHYCLSDGHQMNYASIKRKDIINEKDIIDRLNKAKDKNEAIVLGHQSLEMLKIETDNYLQSIPAYLYDDMNDHQKRVQVRRQSQNYLSLLSQYIAMNMDKTIQKLNWKDRKLNWKVTETVVENRVPKRDEKDEAEELSPEQMETNKRQIPSQYDKITHKYNCHFGIQFKRESEHSDRVIQFYNKPYTIKNQTAFELEISDGFKIRFNVGLKNLQQWGMMIVGGHGENLLNLLFEFAEEYKSFLDFIRYRDSDFDLENTKLLNKFSRAEDGVLAIRLPKPLLDIYSSIKNSQFEEIPKEVYREKLMQKITKRQAILRQWINEADKTSYTEYSMTAELIKEFNILRADFNKNRRDFQHLDRFEELKQIIEEDKRIEKKVKKARYQKMKMLLLAVKWVLGKSKKFNDPRQKNAVCKYLYLLDNKKLAKTFLKQDEIDDKTDSDIALYSASEWLTRLAAKEDTTPADNPQLIERQELHDIFLDKATSFDQAYTLVLELALKKYDSLHIAIQKHIATDEENRKTGKVESIEKEQGRWMWLLQRCKELDLPNLSLKNSANADFRENTKKEVDRIMEILKPYLFIYDYNNQDNSFKEGYMVSLPSRFFEELENFETYFKATKGTHILAYVEEKRKEYTDYFQKISAAIPYLISKEEFAKRINKTDFSKAHEFYTDMVQDAILIKLKDSFCNIHTELIKITSKKNKSKTIEVSHSFKDKKEKSIICKTSIPVKILQRNNGLLKKTHIHKMLELLYYDQLKNKNNKFNRRGLKTDFDYNSVIQRLQKYHQGSIRFISGLLKEEKEYGESQGWISIEKKMDLTINAIPQSFEYKDFPEFEHHLYTKYSNNLEKIRNYDLKEMRNNAMHLDVAEKGSGYFLIPLDS